MMKAMKVSVSLIRKSHFSILNLHLPSIQHGRVGSALVRNVQDVVLIAVKFKARLLNPRINMGSLEAGVHHWAQLRLKYSIHEHFLREKDLNHRDRQNYDAVLHIINTCPLLDKIS